MAKRILHCLLLTGMALLIPCFLFTVGNTLFSTWPLYHRNQLALCVLTPLCLFFLLFTFRQIDRHERFFARHRRTVLLSASFFLFFVQIYLSCAFRHIPITDAEQCFTAAQLLADTGAFETSERSYIYFSRYPFNLGFVYLLSLIFRFFSLFSLQDRYLQTVVCASLLFQAGFFASASVTQILGGIRAQMKMVFLFLICFPFWYASAELYTDVYTISFLPLILLCWLKLRDAPSWKSFLLYSFLFAFFSFFGFQLRVTSIIVSLACLISSLFEARFRSFFLSGLLLVIVLFTGNSLLNRINAAHLGEENLRVHRIPIYHYLAMGLPVHEDEGYGQYGDGGWLLFTTSFEDPKERDAALLSEIRDRVYFLRYPSRLLNMMSRKNLSSFGDGSFRLHEIIEGDEHEINHPAKEIVYHRGSLYDGYRHFCTGLFLAEMILVCFHCVQALRNRSTDLAALYITLLGAFLYLCIWETKSRYFFQYQMIFLCACALVQNEERPTHKS